MKDLEAAIIRSILSALLIVLALMFLLASIGFLLVVAYQLAEPVWGPPGAAGLVAGICFGLTLFLLGIAAILGRSRQKRAVAPPGAGTDAPPSRDPALDTVLKLWVRRSPWEALSTALIGGVVYVKVPEARSLVMRMLTTPPTDSGPVDRRPAGRGPVDPGPGDF
ncbi:phage holin family protein [Fodinicurvata sp. EGI_FJ10296]|uniref:phage holin family protein n=1 Tax=Fodinicurvata sp. EGI_FJ10296 TaxID=3231908 RepID=UPI0034529E06